VIYYVITVSNITSGSNASRWRTSCFKLPLTVEEVLRQDMKLMRFWELWGFVRAVHDWKVLHLANAWQEFSWRRNKNDAQAFAVSVSVISSWLTYVGYSLI